MQLGTLLCVIIKTALVTVILYQYDFIVARYNMNKNTNLQT